MEDFAQKTGGGGYPSLTIEIFMSSSAILLLAHGTPNRLSEMSDYLQHVTGGRPMPRHVIAELQHRYAEIGLKDQPLPEGPPLTHWTLRQAELLVDEVWRYPLQSYSANDGELWAENFYQAAIGETAPAA